MLISFDSRTYLISRFKSIYRKHINLRNKFNYLDKFFGRGSGPKEFISDLINSLEDNKLAKTTFNFFESDFHILNSGSYSFLWRKFILKSKARVVLRVDGIGIDENNFKNEIKITRKITDLLNKSENIIYQSKFSRDCFFNTYGKPLRSKIILNGANELPLLDSNSAKTISHLNKISNGKYYTVAGRFVCRKRIKEVIEEFNNSELGYLVVLSDIPIELRFKNKRIIYLGMVNPLFARFIISNSFGLIHFDKYDWCPNVVIWALKDGIPVICSNYGGTPEIVGSKGIIIKEFPNDLTPNIDGIKYVNQAKFPREIFKENILSFNKKKRLVFKSKNLFAIKKTAMEYMEFIKQIN